LTNASFVNQALGKVGLGNFLPIAALFGNPGKEAGDGSQEVGSRSH